LFIPFQFGLVSPFLAPVWVAGLIRLFRDTRLSWARAIGWAYVFMVVAFIAKGGKPYYVAGMFPVLLAAGAEPTLAWVRRGRARVRRVLLVAAFVLSAPAIAVALPVVPLSTLPHTPIVDWNYDIGETVDWPVYVEQIARLYQEDFPGSTIIASNYGEAGAIDRYGEPYSLPHAYSGHNGYYYWGPPPGTPTTVIAIGYDEAFLQQSFTQVWTAGNLRNYRGIDNDERNAPLWVCRGPKADWHTLWPRFRDIG
jgi:hypothetical protein